MSMFFFYKNFPTNKLIFPKTFWSQKLRLGFWKFCWNWTSHMAAEFGVQRLQRCIFEQFSMVFVWLKCSHPGILRISLIRWFSDGRLLCSSRNYTWISSWNKAKHLSSGNTCEFCLFLRASNSIFIFRWVGNSSLIFNWGTLIITCHYIHCKPVFGQDSKYLDALFFLQENIQHAPRAHSQPWKINPFRACW